jgi:P4 family phage/plasmid primase-like protien
LKERNSTRNNRERWRAYKEEVHSHLRAEDVYSEIQGQRSSGDGWVMGRCPWHDDRNPSFAFNKETLKWKCHAGCGEGDVFDYVMRVTGKRFREVVTEMGDKVGLPRLGNSGRREERPPISESQVKSWHQALGENEKAVGWLHEKRGLSDDTLEKYQIGWVSQRRRYTISVRDENGKIVNVRLHSPTTNPKVLNYTNGKHKYGTPPRLYGVDELAEYEGSQVVICEGEWDRLLLQQESFMAVTSTHGCGVFLPEWTRWFKEKDVVILYDCDEEGKRAAKEVVLKVLKDAGCSSIRNVVLPLSGTKEEKDVTDWFVHCGFSAEKLRELIATSRVADVQEEAAKMRAIEELEAKVAEHGLRAVDVAEAYLDQRGYRKEGMLTFYYWRGDWWKWNGRRYARLPVDELEAGVMGFLGENEATRSKASVKCAKDVIANLKGKCLLDGSVEQPSWLVGRGGECAPDCISMENGILDIAAVLRDDLKYLKAHSPLFFSCVTLPYSFDPDAKCRMWEAFLQEVQPDPEARELLQEFSGLCLTHDTSQHKFLMLEGEGRNGKGVFWKVLRAMLGKENVSALPLSAFSDKFALSSTLGKLVNISEEAGKLNRAAEDVLKTFVGGDARTVDRKFKDLLTTEFTARLVVVTNTRPPFVDRTRALWERLILVPFPVFIPEERRIPKLELKLCEELSGIFNWAIVGLSRLRRRGRFVGPQKCIDAKQEYRAEVNSARAFLFQFCGANAQGEIEKGELYRNYKQWCEENGDDHPLNQVHFGKEVSRWYREVTGMELPRPVRRRAGNERTRFYQGIELLTEEPEGGPGKSLFCCHRGER